MNGACAWALWGAGGQAAINYWTRSSRERREEQATQQSAGSFLDSKYSPLSGLSDHDYMMVLRERLLRVEADIALIDDNIRELEDERQRREISSKSPPQSGEQNVSLRADPPGEKDRPS